MTKKIIEYVTIWIMNGEGLKKYIPKLLNSALHVQQTLLVDKVVHDVLVTEINKITEYAGTTMAVIIDDELFEIIRKEMTQSDDYVKHLLVSKMLNNYVMVRDIFRDNKDKCTVIAPLLSDMLRLIYMLYYDNNFMMYHDADVIFNNDVRPRCIAENDIEMFPMLKGMHLKFSMIGTSPQRKHRVNDNIVRDMTKDVSVISIDDDTLVSTPKDKTDKPKEEIDGAAAAAAEVYQTLPIHDYGFLSYSILDVIQTMETVPSTLQINNDVIFRSPSIYATMLLKEIASKCVTVMDILLDCQIHPNANADSDVPVIIEDMKRYTSNPFSRETNNAFHTLERVTSTFSLLGIDSETRRRCNKVFPKKAEFPRILLLNGAYANWCDWLETFTFNLMLIPIDIVASKLYRDSCYTTSVRINSLYENEDSDENYYYGDTDEDDDDDNDNDDNTFDKNVQRGSADGEEEKERDTFTDGEIVVDEDVVVTQDESEGFERTTICTKPFIKGPFDYSTTIGHIHKSIQLKKTQRFRSLELIQDNNLSHRTFLLDMVVDVDRFGIESRGNTAYWFNRGDADLFLLLCGYYIDIIILNTN